MGTTTPKVPPWSPKHYLRKDRQGHAVAEVAAAAPSKDQEKAVNAVARWACSASASSTVDALALAQPAACNTTIVQALCSAIKERMEATEGDRIKKVIEVEREAAEARMLAECAKLRNGFVQRELDLALELAKAQSQHKQLEEARQKTIDAMRLAVITAVNGNFLNESAGKGGD